MSQKYYECVYVRMYSCLSYPARKAHALNYIVIWGHVWLYHIFTKSRKRHNFGEKVTEHKMCFMIFSKTFVWNISHCEKN